MNNSSHDHSFGQDQVRPGERRTLMVIAITATMMVVEIAAGFIFGSMALLADGLHMASHAAALSIAAFAYFYARRHAFGHRYTFGTGKVNALAGFAGANLLAKPLIRLLRRAYPTASKCSSSLSRMVVAWGPPMMVFTPWARKPRARWMARPTL